jgi:hypothetical protein
MCDKTIHGFEAHKAAISIKYVQGRYTMNHMTIFLMIRIDSLVKINVCDLEQHINE